MKKIEKKVDLNAHIADLQTRLCRENEKNFLNISFKNVSGREISSLVFQAKGYDYFGDAIVIDDKKQFPVVLDALHLKTGESVKNASVMVADEIRNIDLEEEKTVFSDGTSEEKKKPKEKIYYIDCFEKDRYKDKPELDELVEQDERFCCYPKEEAEGWICACGYFNRSDYTSCVNCGHDKKETFFGCSKKAVAQSRRIKQIAFEKHLQQMDRIRAKQENMELAGYFVCVLFILCIIILALWIYIRLR